MIPLLAAPLCVLLRKPAIVWIIVLAVSWLTFLTACSLLAIIMAEGEISYFLGGWTAPWGIEYRLDSVNAFVLIIVAAIGAVVMTFARASVRQEVAEDRIYLFYTAYLLCLVGLYGVVITGDVFNLFVFIEISSLSSYALISLGRDKRALLAAYRYLILGTIGATFILIGVGFLFVISGTLNMTDLAVRLQSVENTRTAITALAFLTVGICIKFALFPLHSWLPNAYTYAPSVISAFLASTTTKVFIYVLLRFMFSLFGPEFVFDVMLVDKVLLVCALLAVFSGSITAIYQDNIKKMLAFSSIAQIGYMILGISLVSVSGLLGGIIHLFNHALMKSALFLCVACVVYRTGSVSIRNWEGLGRLMPWTMAAFVTAGLSLIGVPLTVGFISKWYLVQAALERDWWWLAVAVVAGSLLAVIYIWRVVEVAYFREARQPETSRNSGVREVPLSMLLPLWALVIANIYYGIDAGLTSRVAGQAAKLLLGVE